MIIEREVPIFSIEFFYFYFLFFNFLLFLGMRVKIRNDAFDREGILVYTFMLVTTGGWRIVGLRHRTGVASRATARHKGFDDYCRQNFHDYWLKYRMMPCRWCQVKFSDTVSVSQSLKGLTKLVTDRSVDIPRGIYTYFYIFP